MKLDFYFSPTQKAVLGFIGGVKTYINGNEYTESIEHGKDITEDSEIKDYEFVCTGNSEDITFE